MLTGYADLLRQGAHVLVQPVLENPMRTLAEMADLILRGVPISRIPVARPKRLAVVANVPAMEAMSGPSWKALMPVVDRFFRGPGDSL